MGWGVMSWGVMSWGSGERRRTLQTQYGCGGTVDRRGGNEVTILRSERVRRSRCRGDHSDWSVTCTIRVSGAASGWSARREIV